jgi:uncharacterized protein (DUF1015 family)
MEDLKKFGIRIPSILLPAKPDLQTWSVIACDQYTQNNDYWKKVEQTVGDRPSTLRLILPEIYLDAPDKAARIRHIHAAMKNYLNTGVFAPEKSGFIYTERTTAYGRVRRGLIAAIDLDAYEWRPFSKSLIRSTEATIVERLPPRMEIRRKAPLETPHIMLLVNDPDDLLVGGTGNMIKTAGKQPVYSGSLMQNGGSITGWAVEAEKETAYIETALEKIAHQNTANDGSVFLFATGDGNHSLAAAKAVWDECRNKQPAAGECPGMENNPLRYALVEIVNIYDDGLTFEPIHRVLFHAEPEKLVAFLRQKSGGIITAHEDFEELERAVHHSPATFGFIYRSGGQQQYRSLTASMTELAVSRLQPELDSYIAAGNTSGAGISIDYIHGTGEVRKLGSREEGTVSILLPPIAKESLFTTINTCGPLPRKSFSMGEADEKRFYLECRKLSE